MAGEAKQVEEVQTPVEAKAFIDAIVKGEAVVTPTNDEPIEVPPTDPHNEGGDDEPINANDWADLDVDDEPKAIEPEAVKIDSWSELAKEHDITEAPDVVAKNYKALTERVKELESQNNELATVAYADEAISNLREVLKQSHEELIDGSIKYKITEGASATRELTDEEMEIFDKIKDEYTEGRIIMEGMEIKSQIKGEITRLTQESTKLRKEQQSKGNSPYDKDKLMDGVKAYLATQDTMHGLPISTKGETEKKSLIEKIGSYAVNDFLPRLLKDPTLLSKYAWLDKFGDKIKQTTETSIRNRTAKELLIDKNGNLTQGKPKGDFQDIAKEGEKLKRNVDNIRRG